jgi:glycosyltransferase involved in cell wall biosynthesis
LANLPDLLRWQWSLYRWLVRHRNAYELIHACDFDTVLPALLIKFLWGKKVIYDIFDFYAAHLRATPVLFKKLIKTIDLRVISWVDALILADDSRREQIYGAKPKRLTIIYNTPEDLNEAKKSQPNHTQEHGTINGSLRLAYVGLLQKERGLFQMLEIMSRHPEWSLDLAGFGGDSEEIHDIARQMHNVRWHGRIPYEQALHLNQAADVLFATYDPAIPNHRYSSPNKVFEAMMLGKPLIAARNTNMDQIIKKEDCGIIIEYGNLSELETAISLLKNDPSLRFRLGRNGRQAYQNTYSWLNMQSRLISLYDEVLGNETL